MDVQKEIKGGSRKGKHGERESSKRISTTMPDISILIYDYTLSYSAPVFCELSRAKISNEDVRFPAAKFRNGRTRKTEVPTKAVIRTNSLSSIALELETRKFDTSTLCSLPSHTHLQYTVSFVRFFTHFELHILLVDTVTFNPNLWFVGELLVEDFSRVWMDARFSGKLSLRHAATYIVFGILSRATFYEFREEFSIKDDSIGRKYLLLKLEIKSFILINLYIC